MKFSTLIISGFLLTACGKFESKKEEQVQSQEKQDHNIILKLFADHVVEPTYKKLYEEAKLLTSKIKSLQEKPSQESLLQAQKAWINTRIPWEQSEGFLFGPVDTLGLDPRLDSWPLDHVALEQNIASANTLSLTQVANEAKGFHALEFLLFGDQKSRKVEQLSAEQLIYLVQLAVDLEKNSKELFESWRSKILLDGSSYRDAFVQAGEASNKIFTSTNNALQQMAEGMAGIANEVASGKLGGPLDDKDLTLIESRYSYNSLNDFKNNIVSLRNVWAGLKPSSSDPSLRLLVLKKDPELVAKIDFQIEESIKGLEGIKAPFYLSVQNEQDKPKIKLAQQKIIDLYNTLVKQLLPLIQEI